MDKALKESMHVMERAFRRLEEQVPCPVEKDLGLECGFVLRYEDQSLEQAILQKLARMISGLAASRVLLSHGYIQEQSSMHRVLDELGEDILFLAVAISNDTVTDLHKKFLKSFYDEDYDDHTDIVGTLRSREMVPRRKIRAYLARTVGDASNPSREISVGKTISKLFSGFVHCASPQVMEMCAGSPAKFRLFGMRGSPLVDDHEYDSWNYFYRVLISLTTAAKAFGDVKLVDDLYQYMDEFERQTGRSGGERGARAT